MMKLPLACGSILWTVLAACSSVPKAAPVAAAGVAGTAAAHAIAASTTPKLVCEDTSQIGSHMQAHICLTPEQVAQRQKDSQEAARDLQNRAQPIDSSGSGMTSVGMKPPL